jgi:sugar phosphate isomerase/epimerase
MMQAGIFAKTFSAGGALGALQAAKAAGFETVQFNMACCGLPAMPDEIAPETIAEIAEASRETGVSIAAVSATYNMIHPDPKVRADGMRKLDVILNSARGMGTSLVTLCTGTRDAEDQWRHHPDNQGAEAWRDLLTEIVKAAALAEAHEVFLGIEPELANAVNSADAAKRLLNEIGSSRLRIVLDPANLFETASERERQNIVSHAAETLSGNISMAHAKDRDPAGGFVAAGTGVIDFPHFFTCLKQTGFDGPLVAHGLSEAEASAVAAFLAKAMRA